MTSKINGKIKYEFVTKMWQYIGQGGWHFVLLPHDLGKDIRDNLKSEEEGWGRLKATPIARNCIPCPQQKKSQSMIGISIFITS